MPKYINKTAFREYSIIERLIAGLVLTGPEAKAIRTRGVELKDAFVRIKNGEAFLVNALVHPYPFARAEDQNPSRERKLLLSQKELKRLMEKKTMKLTIIPISCFNAGRWFKLEIGVGRIKP